MIRRLAIFFTIVVILACGAGFGGFLWLKASYEAESGTQTDKVIIIQRGSSVASIAAFLQHEGLVRYARVFRLGEKLISDYQPLKAGEYLIPANASASDIAKILKSGQQVVHKLTFAEGLSSIEIVDLLRDESLLIGEIPKTPDEGSLLPETYHFHRGEHRMEILKRMSEAMTNEVEPLWEERADSLPFANPKEAVILASIVEKETGVSSERGLVAAVFINRLRLGMRLQSDPTVVYGITLGAGPLGRTLTRNDLEAKTEYNTYQIDGLPPTPIANPGKASLAAALKPEVTDAIYFVADGSGGHAFARSLDEHNRNVKAWRKLQRQN